MAAADLLALTLLTPPGELGRRHRRRQRPALRRADGLRRPPRRLLRHPGRAQAADARPDHRRVRRRPRGSRPCAWRCRRASSTSGARRRRATSAPPRCCWRSWPRCTRSITAPTGSTRIAAPGAPPHRDAGRRAARGSASTSPRRAFFDTLTVRVPGRGRATCAAERAPTRHQPAAGRCGPGRHRARRDDPARRRRDARGRSSRRRDAAEIERLDRAVEDRLPAALRRRARSCTHPVFHAPPRETEMLRYLRRLAGQGPGARSQR